MPRGRKKNIERTVKWQCQVRESVAAKIDLLLTNPLTGKVQHTSKGQLTDTLLTQYLREKGVEV